MNGELNWFSKTFLLNSNLIFINFCNEILFQSFIHIKTPPTDSTTIFNKTTFVLITVFLGTLILCFLLLHNLILMVEEDNFYC